MVRNRWSGSLKNFNSSEKMPIHFTIIGNIAYTGRIMINDIRPKFFINGIFKMERFECKMTEKQL